MDSPLDGGHATYGEESNLDWAVEEFITRFHRAIADQNIGDIQRLYVKEFVELSESVFSDQPWPSVAEISHLVNDDNIFILFYNEMYFRHLFTLEKHHDLKARFEAWNNYCDLFQMLLSAESGFNLILPPEWIWDMIDGFVTQFQEFCTYRTNVKALREDEIKVLRNNPAVFATKNVLNYLHALINKSDVKEYMTVEKSLFEGRISAEDIPAKARNLDFMKFLGYYATICILRVHTITGDFYSALRAIELVDLNRKGLYSQVPACHSCLSYHAGFCYLMTRRYGDATRIFNSLFYHLSKLKTPISSAVHFDYVSEVMEKIYCLLALCLSFYNGRIDEQVQKDLAEKYSDEMMALSRGGDDMANVLNSLFKNGSPELVSAASPNYDDPRAGGESDSFRLHSTMFFKEVKQQHLIPVVKSYLKLYSTIELSKLASFLDMDKEELRTQLICLKHRAGPPSWSNAPDANQTSYLPLGDIGFFLENADNGDAMIHVVTPREDKELKRQGDSFLRQIGKLHQVIKGCGA
eukprot:CAMPEP_0113899942 /NCGR_PEP_ID=MMETSP0780_2-20120614/20367_1 /TAXON_ID=652834 /ORGANISM="Palpitomonas bilix" /LENGTH=522 /DNA_ID=CAMNT_0000892277 /DNA_START=93 /DNA_END=1661 /DNA_ORIENTATION=- /assembly_acc=CAM_ASM_000599